jgi:hypothetical protein
MIEIGETTNSRMTYADAVFYCFCLGGDWRLPTEGESARYIPGHIGWLKDDFLRHGVSLWPVTPVRDLKDD